MDDGHSRGGGGGFSVASGLVPAAERIEGVEAQLARSERIDLQSLRAKIRAALGKDRAAPYFELLRKYISAQLTKRELDVHAATLLQNGWEANDTNGANSSRSDFIALHNLFIKAILHNAACSEGPPLPPNSSIFTRGAPGMTMEYGSPRTAAAHRSALPMMAAHSAAAAAMPGMLPGGPQQLASQVRPQGQPYPQNQSQALPLQATKRSSSSTSTKSGKGKREKKSKKNKKSKKSGSNGTQSSSRPVPTSTAAQQAAALIAARQEHLEQANRLQQAQQAQQAVNAATLATADHLGAIPLSAGDRKLFGSRSGILHHRIANQTRTHAAIRQHMQAIVAEYAANVQTPGALRDYQENVRSDGAKDMPDEGDDVEVLLSHVSNDAVVLVHDALQAYLRGVLQQLALSTELHCSGPPVPTTREHENISVFGGAVIIQTDEPSEDDDMADIGVDEYGPSRKRRKAVDALDGPDSSLRVSLRNLQHVAARDPCAQGLFQDDRERLLERVSLLL